MAKILNTSQKNLVSSLPRTHIEASQGWVSLKLREVWTYRELLYFLTWRDIKVRYKQTALGAIWAILQPFLTMVIFTLIFNKLGRISSDGLPYPIFSYAGLLPWNYFSQSLSNASNSLVGSSHLITKVYFPRLVVPVSAVLSGVVDLLIAFVVLVGMMWFYEIQPTLGVLLLPAFLLLALVTALGCGLWLSALNVQYRDVQYIVPFLTMFWMYASPVIYSSSSLEEPWRTISGINPMTGVIEGFRWALLGSDPPKAMIGLSVVVALVILVSGAFYFRRMEKTFADVV